MKARRTLTALTSWTAPSLRRLKGSASTPLWHPVYPFPDGMQPRHEYRSVNVDTYKVFYRVDEERELVLIYRIRHAASDFTAVEFG